MITPPKRIDHSQTKRQPGDSFRHRAKHVTKIMSAEIYSAESHRENQKTCRTNNCHSPAPLLSGCKEVCSEHAKENGGRHRVPAGKTVAGEIQNWVGKQRPRTMEGILQKLVQ